MLDLNAGVHLDEIEPPVLVQELDRTGTQILDLAHRGGDDLPDLGALGSVERGRGAFLQKFLVAALQRAVALAEMNGVALAVAQHLDLDVARGCEIFLQVDRIVSKRRFRLGARGRERRRQVGGAVRDLHAAPAAARCRLDQDRKADVVRDRERVVI